MEPPIKNAAAPRMTVGQVFKMFRQMPEMRKLVENCYLDEDTVAAAKRFQKCGEFQEILRIARAKGVRPPARILDLGGGNGVCSLAWHGEGYRVTLAEPDPSDIVGFGVLARLVKEQHLPINICSAIGEDLPFPDKSFDLVFARQLMHHVSSLEAVCKEVRRVLRDGGVFLNAREHVVSKHEDIQVFCRTHPVHRYTGGENAYLVGEYAGALRSARFSDVAVYGPWESAINYAPASQAEFQGECQTWLAGRFGIRVARHLAAARSIQRIFGSVATRKDHTPGRMYTFVAVRALIC